MKFLVTVTPRQVAPMPPGAIADVLSAQRDWLKQKLEDGTLDCAYGFIGGGGVGIANADSIEEMHALLVQSPGFPIGDNKADSSGRRNTSSERGRDGREGQGVGEGGAGADAVARTAAGRADGSPPLVLAGDRAWRHKP